MSGIDFEADSGAAAASGDSLKRVQQLAQLMADQAREVERCEAVLAAAKEAFQRTERVDLPELMREIGIAELKLEDGSTVLAGEDFTTSIPEGRMDDVVRFLAGRDHDGIVKTYLAIAFDRGERSKADELLAELAEKIQQPITKKESIHPQTLKAYVKEQKEAGDPVPDDLFGVYTFNRAKIKLPTKPKTGAKPRAAKPAK